MNEKMGTFIGNTIGMVKGYDVKEDGLAWDIVLRVFIELNFYKSVTRGRTLNILGSKSAHHI